MIVKMNGMHLADAATAAEPASSWIDKLPGSGGMDQAADYFTGKIAHAFTGELQQWFLDIIQALNANSAEIGTLAIEACAFGMMMAPFMGSSSAKWFGRLMGAFWLTVTWRVII